VTIPGCRLAWHRRFEARVIASVILLVALSLTAILVATTRVVTARSTERTLEDLEAARIAFHRLVDDRAEFASAQSALVTALPVFRAHLTDTRLAQDVATLEAMAGHYRQQLKADFAIVADRHAKWVVASEWPAGVRPSPELSSMIAGATAGTPARRVVTASDRLFLVVSQPAGFADELLGTLTVGYALDDEIAKNLADVTHCEVNLAVDGRVYASSLPSSDRAALTAAMAGGRWPADGVFGKVERIGEGEYMLGAFPLLLDGSSALSARLILLEDWRPTQAFVGQIRWRLLAAGAVVFAMALAMSVFFSRRMGRPLENLAAAAEDIAGGNWERQLPVRGTAEEAMMAQAVNTMTTSLRHWYEEAKTRDDQLRQAQKLEALGRLAGGLAHDFNNFLTAINGYGGLLLDGFEPSDKRRSKVEGILKAADTAAGLTRQLLAFSRRRVMEVRVLSLDRVLAGTERMLRRLIGEDVELTTSIGRDIGCVRADPNQIEQVLLNLVVNARDAMPRGGRIRIEVAGAVFPDAADMPPPPLPAGRYVRLSVRDEGCGMTADVKARIFEPFFTTKPEGVGTGLDLAVVYGIVEQLSGAIVVDTEVSRGTTFHIYLPHTNEREAEDTVDAPAVAGRGTETVLLVEDEPQVASLIAGALQTNGYTVLQAAHGAEALDIAQAHATPIHLLLTDVVMPGMNGRELADRVGVLRRDIRTLYMSGYADDAILKHGVETATAQFIPKPFSMNTLTAKIRDVLTTPCEGVT
jgi:signal transduction histidine kinase